MRTPPLSLDTSLRARHLGWLLPLAILAIVAWASGRAGVPLHDLLRDPTSVTHVPLHVGLVSYLGVLAWGAGAMVALFAGSVLWRHPEESRTARMFVAVGALSTVLMLDDLFLFHETVFPHYLGIAEKATLLGYATAMSTILVYFRHVLLRFHPVFLVMALGFFGTSLVVDLFQHPIENVLGPWRILLEDGAKFLGISTWSAHFAGYSFTMIRRRMGAATPRKPQHESPPITLAA